MPCPDTMLTGAFIRGASGRDVVRGNKTSHIEFIGSLQCGPGGPHCFLLGLFGGFLLSWREELRCTRKLLLHLLLNLFRDPGELLLVVTGFVVEYYAQRSQSLSRCIF